LRFSKNTGSAYWATATLVLLEEPGAAAQLWSILCSGKICQNSVVAISVHQKHCAWWWPAHKNAHKAAPQELFLVECRDGVRRQSSDHNCLATLDRHMHAADPRKCCAACFSFLLYLVDAGVGVRRQSSDRDLLANLDHQMHCASHALRLPTKVLRCVLCFLAVSCWLQVVVCGVNHQTTTPWPTCNLDRHMHCAH
jgi:hypothetical protein